jgi:NAD(P)-dependent dehydrogenase (short-subunit alcohol dehydrogenase family)
MLNKRVIVTGGTYGIGASIVKALVHAGADVACVARSADLGRQQAEELTAAGPGRLSYHQGDVSVRSQIREAFAAAVAEMGGLDSLVHVAGVETSARPEDETDEGWDRMFAVNAKGTFIANQEAFPHLRAGGGHILNFTSGAAMLGSPHIAAYAASKGAVLSWTRAAAQAWGQHGITVNSVSPAVWTPMYDEHRSRLSPEELEAHDAVIARNVHIGGKLGDPETDLAPVIVFLCGDGARYITGQTICIDGGAIKVR